MYVSPPRVPTTLNRLLHSTHWKKLRTLSEKKARHAQLTSTLCQILLTKEHHPLGPEDKDNQHHGIPELIILRVELSSSALAIVVQICMQSYVHHALESLILTNVHVHA